MKKILISIISLICLISCLFAADMKVKTGQVVNNSTVVGATLNDVIKKLDEKSGGVSSLMGGTGALDILSTDTDRLEVKRNGQTIEVIPKTTGGTGTVKSVAGISPEANGDVDKGKLSAIFQLKGDYALRAELADMETKTHAGQTYQPKGNYAFADILQTGIEVDTATMTKENLPGNKVKIGLKTSKVRNGQRN